MLEKAYEFYEYKLHMVKERQIRFLGGDQITDCVYGSKLIREVIRSIGQTDRENFVAVMLNTKLVPIGANLVGLGGLDRCTVQPRDVVKVAINLPCQSLILGHNHPSSNTDPSPEDKAITLMIMAAANLHGVTIVDHIIVDMDSDQYTSFMEDKIIDEMKQKVGRVIDQISRS